MTLFTGVFLLCVCLLVSLLHVLSYFLVNAYIHSVITTLVIRSCFIDIISHVYSNRWDCQVRKIWLAELVCMLEEVSTIRILSKRRTFVKNKYWIYLETCHTLNTCHTLREKQMSHFAPNCIGYKNVSECNLRTCLICLSDNRS